MDAMDTAGAAAALEAATEASMETMAQVAPVRAAFYAWLAAAFSGPASRELLELFREPGLAETLEQVAGPEVAAEAAAAAAEADLDELRWDYNALFMVPQAQYLTPYESVYRGRYTDERGEVHLGGLSGPETLEVVAFYREYGMEVDPQKNLLPDFAGVELDFLRLLSERESQAWAAGDGEAARTWLDAERRFLLDHALLWLPELCDNMAQRARQPFYRVVARIAAAFLATEEATFRALTAGGETDREA